MECSCNASQWYETESSWAERDLRAAKEHKCCECGVIIKKGDQFTYHNIFYEDTIANYCMCLDCRSIVLHFFKDGWIFKNVWDSLSDYIYNSWLYDLPSDCISKLSPTARDKICDLIEMIWERDRTWEGDLKDD